MRFRILLADDHTVVLEGLKQILNRPQFEIVGAVQDGRALVESAARLKPDLIVTDIGMPSLSGVEAARQICKSNPRTKIVFLTMHPEAIYAVEAMKAGASGYILKHAAGEELLLAIGEILQGRTYVTPSLRERVTEALQAGHRKTSEGMHDGLTSRQREVLHLLAEGRQPKEIAAKLKISYRTVEFHKYRIMETLGLRNFAELIGYAVRQGIAG